MHRISAKLRKLGFTIWSLKKEDDSSIVLIETEASPSIAQHDPFKSILDESHHPLTNGGRGGFSFNEIDKRLLPKFAERMGIAIEQLRLPTQQECLLTASDTGQDTHAVEWFSDGRKQPTSQDIITLQQSIEAHDQIIHCLSDDSIYDLHSDRIALAKSLEEQKKQEQTIATLRGNSKNAEFVSSDDHNRDSYFRCLIDLGSFQEF
jgi:chorismate mutase